MKSLFLLSLFFWAKRKGFFRFCRFQQKAKKLIEHDEGTAGVGANTMTDEAGTSIAGATNSTAASSRYFEVFLNFRGPDSRSTVVDVLCDALDRAGVRFFYDDDDESIRKGKVIKNEIMEAITNSKIYIPIFSRNYASSKWCLLELEEIIKCWEATQGQKEEKTILPVFYDVDVSTDLKLKTDLYKAALEDKTKEHGEARVKQWEIALRKAAGIKGWNIRNHGLVKLTKIIVELVKNELRPRSDPEKAIHPYVGIDSHMTEIMKLLDRDAPDVRYIAIHGMFGVGKTTLARLVYNDISSCFPQGDAFLSVSEVREKFGIASIVNLQKVLISKLFRVNSLGLTDTDQGVDWIKGSLKDKKVLIVLDDLDKRDQLSKLVGQSSWFAMGSRIIITTNNIEIVPEGEGFYPYKMTEMKDNDALKLFSREVFKRDSPPVEYNVLSKEAVKTTGGNPLATGAIAPIFRLDNRDEWVGLLEELKKGAPKDVMDKFMMSYEQLDNNEKEIFLDIACLFIDREKDDASYYWKAQQRCPVTKIMVLKNRSLIEVVDGNKIWMNGLLRDLGRQIVDEKTNILERRSRLWLPDVALEVVRGKKGTEEVLALNLGKIDGQDNFDHEQLKGLKNLKFLEIKGGTFKREDFKNIFSELIWFSWNACPPKFNAINFSFEKLLVLMLSETQITCHWNGWDEIKAAKDLKVLKCTGCRFLKKSPDFSSFLKLQKLVFNNCPTLMEIDQSIGMLNHLTYLEIMNPLTCTRSPDDEVITFPFDEDKTQILPDSICNLKSLSVMKLGLVNLLKLPDSIGDLTNLKYLYLWCRKVSVLPDSLGKLKLLIELDISFTAITKLPKSVTNLRSLKVFKCKECHLKEVPDMIKRLIPLD